MRSLSAVNDSTLQWSIAVLLQRSPERMERTLLSVLENLPPASEVLLVLDGEYEDPYQLEGEVRFVRARRRASWSQCANAALAAARGKWLQVLPAGAMVEPGWCDWLLHLPRGATPGAVVPQMRVRHRGAPAQESESDGSEASLPLEPWHPCRLARALSGAGIGGSGFFFHRAGVQQAGGWRPALAAPWADVELVDRLLRRGFPLAHAPDCRIELPSETRRRPAAARGWHQRRLALLVQTRWQAVGAALAGVPGLMLRLAGAPARAGQTLAEALGGLGAWLTYPVLRPELPPLPEQRTLPMSLGSRDRAGRDDSPPRRKAA